jgi:hypothetical protein
MNSLFGNSKRLSEREDCLTSRMSLADFGIACELYLGLVGLERRRQWNAVVEPGQDTLNRL